jgi:hypothetical protein
VRRPPNKILYEKGEKLDLEGLVVLGTYSDASTKILTVDASNVSGFDSSKSGEQTIFVTLDGKITNFTVTIL